MIAENGGFVNRVNEKSLFRLLLPGINASGFTTPTQYLRE
jgi:hypothetical protein